MYKLLIFNEDYADEHNVPALAVMTNKEYIKWCETPSGTLNPIYEESKENAKKEQQKDEEFWDLLRDKGYTLHGHPNTGMIPANDKETLDAEKEYRKSSSYKSRISDRDLSRVHSNIRAYLGNSGECFEENYSDYYLMKEFVEYGVVRVIEIPKEFYKIFKHERLDKLSLCNVFDVEDLLDY